MDMTNATETQATEKQIQYIKSLVFEHGATFRGRMRSLTVSSRAFTPEDATGDRRHEYREYQANALLAQLWDEVKVPETMSAKRASGMIDRMKQSTMTIIDTWLDNDKTAAAYGVLDFINANRDAIEKAVNNA
jgi:hypothetical protein